MDLCINGVNTEVHGLTQRLSNFTPPRDAGVGHSAITSGQMLDTVHFAVCLDANCQLVASTVVIINS